MKSVFYILCWSSMFLLCIPWVANSQTAAPALFMEEHTFDTGEVKEGTRISHDFIIVNRGKATLQIHKVSPG